jgi:hypothetical protein
MGVIFVLDWDLNYVEFYIYFSIPHCMTENAKPVQ